MKRLFDLVVATALLVALLPLFLAIALVILLTMGRPIFFRQQRPGRGGRPFTLVKFRTMSVGASRPEDQRDEARRLTRVGALLRATSLDELPELVNVLRGEMSLVGPRPLLLEYLPLYTEEQARRHEVRPGITGWAQVHGRNTLPWEERFAMDVWYVDHRSFRLDLRILWLTLAQVARRSGVAQPGQVTAQPFRGSVGGTS
ncbi:MAG: sugar transferase [Gemmatimonadales bacterium]